MELLSIARLPLHRPVILEDRCTIRQAALAMSQSEVGSVLLSDRLGEIIGLVTDRDLAIALTVQGLSMDAKAIEVIESPVVAINDDQSIDDLVQLMQNHAIRRVPVMASRSKKPQRCLGVISLDDLIKEKLISIQDAAKILRAQLPRSRNAGRVRLRRLFGAQDSREQAGNEFIHKIAANTGLSNGNARSFLIHVLGGILHRIPTSSGKKFLSQLPSDLRHDLEPELHEGPIDRELTGEAIIDELCQRYSLTETEVHEILRKFWSAMGQQISPGDLHHLSGQLPKRMQKLLELTH